VLIATAALVLARNAAANAGKGPHGTAPAVITIGRWSQQDDRSNASIGAAIRFRQSDPGRKTSSGSRVVFHVARLPVKGGASSDLPEPYPALSINSPLARNPQPAGPGSFWYPIGGGRVCMYAPDSVLPCFTLVRPGATPAGPGLSPQAIAASIADRLSLAPGEIHASPSARGLTGAASWFWLDPTPRATVLSVTLAGERVTVSAEPDAVEWRFGDGGALSGDAGVPYRPGPPPAAGVTHVYDTRCLPGDQGRNPYVLGSCGNDGYTVEAVVSWRISFRASGPVGAAGSLPTRTTETSAVYPVGEARAFLVGGGSQ
jgi:hypothetical protein